MPYLVPALIAGLAAGTTFAAGAWVVGFSVSAFATTLVLSSVAQALARKPKGLNTDQASQLITVRQAISPWQVIFGQLRVAGVMTFRYKSPDEKFWHMVITLACHRCEAIDEIWFNEERVPLQADGRAMGKYAKTITVISHATGAVPATPHQVTVGGTLGAVAGVFLEFEIGLIALRDVSPGTPESLYEYSRSGNTFTFHSGAEGKNYEIQYTDLQPTGESWARVKISLGDEGPTVQPFPDLVAESGGAWSNDHKQYGHTKIYVRLEAHPEVFPAGVPNVTVVMRGAHFFDPRDDSTGYSNNAALAMAHYLTNEEYGLGAVYADEIADDDLVSAANSADDEITLKEGGSEKRYTVNGSFLTSEQPKAVLERLRAACAGELVNQGDKWHITMGVYHAPTVTLSEDHLAGPTQVLPMVATRDGGNANGVKGVFTNPNAKWQSDDIPAYASDVYLAQDGGERRWEDIDLTGFVTSITQAQRLAKIHLNRLRQGLTESGTFKLAAWQVVPGRSVARTDTQLGWSAKAFEVMDSRLAVVPAGDGYALQTDLVLRETSAAVYDWSASEQQLEAATTNTLLPDPGQIAAPGAPVIEEEILETHDGRGVATKALVSWAPSTYPFGPSYQFEYQVVGGSSWTVLQTTRGTDLEIPDIAPGLYDFRVKAIGLHGASSDYSTTRREIFGLTAEPEDVAGFFVTAHEGRARFHLDRTQEKDVQLGGRLWIRWSTLTSGATWNDGSLVKADGYPGDSIVVEGPLYAGTYMAKFEDSTGHLSRNEASFVVTQSLLEGYTTLDTVTFHPAFDGTKVNVAVVDGFLQLCGQTLWDSMVGNLDDQGYIDSLGGVHLDGSCTFTTKHDLGSVQTVRLFPVMKTLAFETSDLWDARTNLMDDWGLVDGSVIEDAEIVPQVRLTDDDPNGSPTWRPWHNLEVMDVTCRGLEYRTLHSSGNVTHNRRLEQFSVAAKQLS